MSRDDSPKSHFGQLRRRQRQKQKQQQQQRTQVVSSNGVHPLLESNSATEQQDCGQNDKSYQRAVVYKNNQFWLLRTMAVTCPMHSPSWTK